LSSEDGLAFFKDVAVQ